MSYKFIPRKALKFGAESLSENILSYGKARVSGSLETSYIVHSKGGCMPGQQIIFTPNEFSRINLGMPLDENQCINSYRLKNIAREKLPIGDKFYKGALENFTYEEYSPHDDESLEKVIKGAHRQIFGNIHCMESERPIELERRLRNGDISIKEFIRQLAKSIFYKYHFFERVSQERSIELNIKHILGRAPESQEEIQKHIYILYQNGFEEHIDSLIDSHEYETSFGSNTVPYPRSWNSRNGSTTQSFLNIAKMTRFFATSDNCIHGLRIPEYTSSRKSKLIFNLLKS